MRLKEISDYKNKIISTIISNENLIKALTNNTSDFLDKPLIPDVTTTVYTNIYPYKYIPTPQNQASSYITMSFSNFSLRENIYKVGVVTFFILCHKSLLKTDYGCIRYDYIANQIDEIFNNAERIGIGELKFNGMSDFQEGSDYMGCIISYTTKSFN